MKGKKKPAVRVRCIHGLDVRYCAICRSTIKASLEEIAKTIELDPKKDNARLKKFLRDAAPMAL